MRKKSVVFFVTRLNSGGIENYLLRFLREKGCMFERVFVWCKSGMSGQLDGAYLLMSNVDLVKIKLGYFDVLSYKRLRRFLAVNEVDVVCDFSGNFSGRVMASAVSAGVKNRVSAYRGSLDHFKDDFFRRLYNRWVRELTLKHSSRIIANSEAALNYFFPGEWKNKERFLVIYNGVNPEKFVNESENLRKSLGIADDAFVVGHTGRFNEAKNHSTIFAVAQRLVEKYPDVYFILCGNGVQENSEILLKEKGLEDRVLVFKSRNDIPAFLNTLDCYFFPSVTEGQPNALIEAMVMGLPFIASDIAPIRETVGDGYPLYPPLDVSAFSDAIEEKYLARDGRDLKMQKAMIERFDYKVRFEEFYRVLLSSESVSMGDT